MNKVPLLGSRKMMLLHGPGIINSRSKLNLIRRSFNINNVVVFEDLEDSQRLIDALLTPSLFNEPRLVIVENPPDDFTLDPSLITHNLLLVIWLDHEINTRSLLLEYVKKSQGEILFFDSGKEVSAFPFLDCLANKDNKSFLEMQKLKLSGFDIFYILTMVFYLLRILTATPKRAPEFVKRKLAKQRINFTNEDIKRLYHKILEIEFGLKSGLLDQSQAEFLAVDSFVS